MYLQVASKIIYTSEKETALKMFTHHRCSLPCKSRDLQPKKTKNAALLGKWEGDKGGGKREFINI